MYNAMEINSRCNSILGEWLESCHRNKDISRNTFAVGIVILDHLRKECPIARDKIISKGGEVKGSRGRKLRDVLDKYEIGGYLKEVTTRQAHQDGQRLLERLEWGAIFEDLPNEERDALLIHLIGRLASSARAWLDRPILEFNLDRSMAPASWINIILEKGKGISGGIVEQHLVGAKLERRYNSGGISIPNYPAHAGDAQTERLGDFIIGEIIYHITAMPSESVIGKCIENITIGKHPVLLVPRNRIAIAGQWAESKEALDKITIIAIEDFLSLNIIEIAIGERCAFFDVLKEIINIYNRRLQEVETNLSLSIDVR